MMTCWRNRSMEKRIMGIGLAFVRGTSPTIFFVFAATLLCGLGSNAVAVDWQFNPQVELGALTNDNYRLNLPAQSQSVSGGETDVQAQLRAVSDLTDFRVTPELRATYFPGKHYDDETDPFLNIDWNQKGQRLNTSLAMNYSKVSIVQILGPESNGNAGQVGTVGSGPGTAPGGLGNPTTGDSGFINVQDRQQTINIMPALDFEYSPRRHFQVTANYADVKFDQNIPGSFVGFKNEGGTVGLAQDLTPRDSLALRAIFSNTQPDTTNNGTGSNTSSYGGVAEWTRHFSTTSQAYIRLGDEVVRSSSSGVSGPVSQSNWVAGGGFIWQYQISQIFLDLTRSVDPSVTGYMIKRDQLRLQATRDFSARLMGVLGVTGLIDNATGNATGFNERKYAIGNVGLQWRYSRAWTLKGSYVYTWQRYQSDPSKEASNAFAVAVVYQPYRDRK
jgi:hypothetical protein